MMKSYVISIGVLYFLTQLNYQVSARHHKDSSNNVIDHPQTLETIKNELHVLKTELSTLELKPNSILALLERKFHLFSKCNTTDVQSKMLSLVAVTIDFLTSTSGPMEDILDKVNQCASSGFTYGISCLLSLRKNCQADIDQIQEAVDTYGPRANALASGLLTAIIKCFTF